MSVQKVPLKAVQKIRQYIKNVLVLPESENHPKSWSSYSDADELPEPKSLSDLGDLFKFGGSIDEAVHAPNTQGQWFISSVNPGAALLKLPGLYLKPKLRLVGYLYRTLDDGVGSVWAVPEALSTTDLLEQSLLDRREAKQFPLQGNRHSPPCPIGALKDVMEAVEGNRSPASFVVASILRRELQEFGALGRSCSWSHHRLIDRLPTQVGWQWRGETFNELEPKVRVFPDGRAIVEFFTCRVTPPVAIVQHLDRYPPANYTTASSDRMIATINRVKLS